MNLDSLVAAAGLHYTDPKKLHKFITEDTTLIMHGQPSVPRTSATSQCWDLVNAYGDALDSNFLADTWKTIANLTGPGLFYGAFGPTATDNADVTSMRFTRNGVLLPPITFTNTASGTRAVLLGAQVVASDSFTGSDRFSILRILAGRIDSNAVLDMRSGYASVMRQEQAESFGARLVEFDTLLVEMKITNAQSDTAAHGRQSGVLWRKY